jgi:hypothetical protein
LNHGGMIRRLKSGEVEEGADCSQSEVSTACHDASGLFELMIK